jgi:hypothetical protein
VSLCRRFRVEDWIYNARIANIEVNDKELIAIKGDAKEDILQSER